MTYNLMLHGSGGRRPPSRRPRDGRPSRPRRQRSAFAAAVIALPLALGATTLLVVLDVLPGMLFVPAYGLLGALIALLILLRP